jgi:hypothetical protein
MTSIANGFFRRLPRPCKIQVTFLAALWWTYPLLCHATPTRLFITFPIGSDATSSNTSQERTTNKSRAFSYEKAKPLIRSAVSSDEKSAFSLNDGNFEESHKAHKPLQDTKAEARLSLGVRGSFTVPENDLKLTTGGFPNFTVGAYGQYRLGRSQQLRATGEWWSFSGGVQTSQQPSRDQTIHTKLQAEVAGGEYLYGLGGVLRRFSLGGGAYSVRWSVRSVDNVTLPALGTAQASGNSQWIRLGEGLNATYRLSRRLELEGRWIHSSYGYEHLPISVVTLGAGWTF